MHICHTKVDFIPSDPNGDENEQIFEDLNCMVFHYGQCKAKCVSLSKFRKQLFSKALLCAWRFLKTLEKNSFPNGGVYAIVCFASAGVHCISKVVGCIPLLY